MCAVTTKPSGVVLCALQAYYKLAQKYHPGAHPPPVDPVDPPPPTQAAPWLHGRQKHALKRILRTGVAP